MSTIVRERDGAAAGVPALPAVSTLPFAEVWACDFEYLAPPGEKPTPVCMVAREFRSGREIRLWQDEFGSRAPFRTDEGALFVSYAANAELKCFLQLGWPMPARILDLYAEFRARTSGMGKEQSRSLLAALSFYGLPHITSDEKDAGRALVMRPTVVRVRAAGRTGVLRYRRRADGPATRTHAAAHSS